MSISEGSPIPAVDVQIMGATGPETISAAELFSGKCIVFGVPGAFTPTCSEQHLPGYQQHNNALRSKGVERIACLSVNDAFVMRAWGVHRKVGGDVLMVADGNADFTRALGLELDASAWGMGIRCQRFAMLCDNGIIAKLWVEPPGEFGVSSAATVLAAL